MDRDTRELVTGRALESAPVPGVLAVFSDGKPLLATIELTRGEAVLGRDDAIGVSDDRVSRQHAIVRHERGRWTVIDQASRNGTFVNGERVDGKRESSPPHVIRTAYTIYLLVDDVQPYRNAAISIEGDLVVGPVYAAALDQARRATGHTLLIVGESGAGKELAARAFHGASGGGPFISVNCASIPEGVADRLLFGSVRGAYSGAVDALGYIESADGGVLFLDEIGELDPAVQAKLLRVVESREVVPLGASTGRRVTTRFCFATFRNLRSAMADDSFRPDLYYRIARDEVRLPALRERLAEVPWLVSRELGDRKAHALLVEACLLRPWPGNIRELRAAIRAAVQRAGDAEIVRAEHLDAEVGTPADPPTAAATRPTDVGKDQLVAALAEHAGNRTAVARALGLHRSQLYRLLDKFGLDDK